MKVLGIIISIIVLWIIYNYYFKTEHYYDNSGSGKFCLTCAEKNINSCLTCFNCGFCVDKNGNSGCVPGDVNGPYNYEGCDKWYYNDPYSYMLQNNVRYPFKPCDKMIT